jgi:hypothetical protein
MADDLARQFEIDIVRWALVEAIIRYGAGDDKRNERIFATLRTATPEMLMALLGLTSLDTAQRLAHGLELLKKGDQHEQH